MRTNRLSRALCLIVFAAPFCLIAEGQNQPPANGSDSKAAEAAPLPELKPPGLPKVVCKGNQLTIAANNSTLGSILREVGRCIGARIEIPTTDVDSRFFDTIGPAPIQDVLTSLLGDTSFNYVIGFSDADPNKVESVLLIAKGADGQPAAPDKGGDQPLNSNRRAFMQMQQNFMIKGIPGQDDTAGPAPAADSGPASNGAPEAPASASPAQPADQAPAAAAEAPEVTARQPVNAAGSVPNSAPPPPSGSTDDQIKNMQQLFEQRRQMMATQPSAPH